MSKSKKSFTGIVYSTDPNFKPQSDDTPEPELLPAAEQKLSIRLDTRQRAGKSVTLVEGFSGPENALETLGKKLKNLCGTGGSVKDGQILVQGDHRQKMHQWLLAQGYKKSRLC